MFSTPFRRALARVSSPKRAMETRSVTKSVPRLQSAWTLGYARVTKSVSASHVSPVSQRRWMSIPQIQETTSTLSSAEYHALSDDTMETLLTSLEGVVDGAEFTDWEVEYSSGVLTLKLGEKGTYVINKQPPNKQIWLSSPLSGPKRYDYSPERSTWIYPRDQETLGELLEKEIEELSGEPVKLHLEPEPIKPPKENVAQEQKAQ